MQRLDPDTAAFRFVMTLVKFFQLQYPRSVAQSDSFYRATFVWRRVLNGF